MFSYLVILTPSTSPQNKHVEPNLRAPGCFGFLQGKKGKCLMLNLKSNHLIYPKNTVRKSRHCASHVNASEEVYEVYHSEHVTTSTAANVVQSLPTT